MKLKILLIQKIYFLIFFVFTILFLFYALSFSTYFKPTDIVDLEFYLYAASYNSTLFNYAAILMFFSVLIILLNSHKRLKYYITNFVIISITALYSLIIPFLLIGELATIKERYDLIDHDLIAELNPTYTKNDIFITLGYYVYILLLIVSVGLIIFLVLKIYERKHPIPFSKYQLYYAKKEKVVKKIQMNETEKKEYLAIENEIMYYRDNKVSYLFAFLALIFNSLFLFLALDYITPSFTIGVKIILNIILILYIFLGMEKVKKYSYAWSIVLIAFGLLAYLRIFFAPVQLFKDEANYSDFIFSVMIIELILTGSFLIISGVIGLRKSMRLLGYKDAKGIERG